MLQYLRTWLELRGDRRAVTALEYALIAGVLVVVVVAAFNTLGGGLNSVFSGITGKITNNVTNAPGATGAG